ncbi:hypothetical protein SOCE26_081540 [Sorangium cellulosum]|uniref:DUF2934 domain-containing protein n=1 Tax=Sorangium cellulosum TaxID=56 RepID=A0A2L0F4X8_SORCE|nr:DUF2934 domain-containing protein [Sorangium cellulosum]AUX46648.1 hypothetical protein SOCE26_081540 [Sorangium cellulosum]
MTSKRKTPARRKTTQAPSQLDAQVAAAAPSAAQPESAVSAPAAVKMPSPAPARDNSPRPAREGAPRIGGLSREERHRLIAKVAYGYAERAGFRTNPVEDWLNAEREVDARLERLAS